MQPHRTPAVGFVVAAGALGYAEQGLPLIKRNMEAIEDRVSVRLPMIEHLLHKPTVYLLDTLLDVLSCQSTQTYACKQIPVARLGQIAPGHL